MSIAACGVNTCLTPSIGFMQMAATERPEPKADHIEFQIPLCQEHADMQPDAIIRLWPPRTGFVPPIGPSGAQ